MLGDANQALEPLTLGRPPTPTSPDEPLRPAAGSPADTPSAQAADAAANLSRVFSKIGLGDVDASGELGRRGRAVQGGAAAAGLPFLNASAHLPPRAAPTPAPAAAAWPATPQLRAAWQPGRAPLLTCPRRCCCPNCPAAMPSAATGATASPAALDHLATCSSASTLGPMR